MRAVIDGDRSKTYAVNSGQYAELAQMEGQTVIRGDALHVLQGVLATLKKVPRLKRNRVIPAAAPVPQAQDDTF